MYTLYILMQKSAACYSLAGVYVKSAYLNLFGWRGREFHETYFLGGGELKKLKAVPLHAMKALGGRGVQLLLILNLGTRWG
jgi:hypothetical protein